MRTHPLIIAGLGTAAVLLFSSRQASASVAPQPRLPALAPPKRSRGSRRLVAFTYRRVQKTAKNGKPYTLTYVVESPATLKSQVEAIIRHSLTDAAFVMATVIASEVGGMHDLAKVAVGHTVLNAAGSKDKIPALVLRPSKGFAGQAVNSFASTAQPPTEADINIAEAVLAGKIADPTAGAVHWDSPAGQDRAHDAGDPLHRTSADIAADRIAEGMEPVYLKGIDQNQLRFWRPRSADKEMVS